MEGLSTHVRGGLAHHCKDKKDGAVDRNATLGSTEDVSRDSISGPPIAHPREYADWKKKKVRRKLHLLSLNSQGIEGAWRMLHLIADGTITQADVVMIQEVGATWHQWKGMNRFMMGNGYKGFYTAGNQNGTKKIWNRHRGVATFVKSDIPVKWHHEKSTDAGQVHAVDIQGTLMINTYCVPSDTTIPEHMGQINDLMVEIGWAGDWIAGGDWNEVFVGSWAATFTMMWGGDQCQIPEGLSTRWEGNRCIDYFTGTLEMGVLKTCLERISDHKIVRASIDIRCDVPMEECRFQQYPVFSKPSWLQKQQWSSLLEEACKEGIHTNWQEACLMVEKEYPEQDSYDEQTMVDFVWPMTCAQLSWMFKTACCEALHCIPVGFTDLNDVKRVQQLANYHKIKGDKVNVMKRKINSKKQKEPEAIRKRWKDLGRLNSLKRQVLRQQFDQEGRAMAKKFFGEDPESLTAEDIIEFERIKREEVEKDQAQNKRNMLSNWSKRMKRMTDKAEWLNRKGFSKTPTVDDGTGLPSNKTHDAWLLWSYWDQFWKGQEWQQEELDQKCDELTNTLKPVIKGSCKYSGRPKLALFKQRIKTVKGCAGADGWSRDEILAISCCDEAVRLVWDSMEVWEQFGLSPTAVGHCKMVMIPKKDIHHVKPDGFRPIAVQSAWWRAWSSTWLRSKWISPWVQKSYPRNISGGIPGSYGPETLAAILDFKLGQLKHGITLDLKHAFDSVHLQLLEDVFLRILPKANHVWIRLAFGHWRKLQRWIILDSHVCVEPLCPLSGLPQGDPLSPLVLVVMVHALQLLVEERSDFPLHHYIYMDDRTIISGSDQAIRQGQELWKQVTDEYHLHENMDKAQKANITKRHQSFEVLGALLGRPKDSDIKNCKAIARLGKAVELYKKIRFLPESMPSRMRDASFFGGGIVRYGWITHHPGVKRSRSHLTELWRSFGKTQFSSVSMRKTVAGAHMHLSISILKRQIRLLQERNKAIQEMYSVDIWSTEMTSLEQMVSEGLVELGWYKEERFGRWMHPLSPAGFEIEVLDNKRWKKICHDLRESYRQVAFDELRISSRHELAEQDIGPYDPERRRLAVKWANNDAMSTMLILGAVQSPLLRSQNRWKEQSVCSKCMMENPHWDHLWECHVGVVPADVLLRRYCWPRSKADFALCTAFLVGARSFLRW